MELSVRVSMAICAAHTTLSTENSANCPEKEDLQITRAKCLLRLPQCLESPPLTSLLALGEWESASSSSLAVQGEQWELQPVGVFRVPQRDSRCSSVPCFL